jgi:nucleoside-diphosphate-sugar epimerase
MRILITGGSGFIGKPVLNTLIKNIDNVEILNLTRKKLNLNSKHLENYKCDLSSPKTYLSKIEEFAPEVVIHLAWEGIPDFSLEMCTKNILTSISFIESITKIKSCKKIIITGSCFEYNNKIGICNEDDVIVPKDYFTFAKKTILSFLELECNKYKIEYNWARLFYVYGPNQRSGSLIPTLIETLKSNKIPDLRTPKNANDFIHVNDVAEGINKMIFNKLNSGIYNLGSGFSTPVIEVTKIIEIATLKDTKLTNQLLQNSIETIKSVDFYADIQKSKKELSWVPNISLQTGINLLINNSKEYDYI